MGIKLLNTSNTTIQELAGDKVRLGETEDTELQTKAQVEAAFPENHPTQLGLVDGDAAVVEPLIPTSGTVLSFDAPRRFGSLKEPISTATISLTNAKEVEIVVYVENATLPPALDPAISEYVIWSGDPYNGTAGVVNKMSIERTVEPIPQLYFLHVRNQAVTVAGEGVDETLLARYQFEETLDDYDTFFDSTNWGNNARAINGLNTPATTEIPTRATGRVGQAVVFNGTGTGTTTFDAADIPTITEAFTNFTIAGWFRTGTPNLTQTCGIFSKSAEAGNTGVWMRKNADGKLEVRINNSTNAAQRIISAYTYSVADTWVHFALRLNGTSFELYINGVLDTAITLSTPMVTNNERCYIGVSQSTFRSAPRTGTMFEDYRIYNRAISPAEIAALAV